jgi:hypothetical protein
MRRNKYIVGIYGRIAANMTEYGKKYIAEWVSGGNSLLENPWYMCHEDNQPYSLISAMQIIDDMAADAEIWVEDNCLDFFDISEENMPF